MTDVLKIWQTRNKNL